GVLAPKPSVVCYSPDATRLAMKRGRLIELLDSASGKNVCSPLTNRLLVTSAAFSPDGQLLAGACGDDSYANGEVRVWQVATGKLLQAVEHEDGVSCVAFSPDGSRFATGTESKLARVFDTKTGHPLTPF